MIRPSIYTPELPLIEFIFERNFQKSTIYCLYQPLTTKKGLQSSQPLGDLVFLNVRGSFKMLPAIAGSKVKKCDPAPVGLSMTQKLCFPGPGPKLWA